MTTFLGKVGHFTGSGHFQALDLILFRQKDLKRAFLRGGGLTRPCKMGHKKRSIFTGFGLK